MLLGVIVSKQSRDRSVSVTLFSCRLVSQCFPILSVWGRGCLWCLGVVCGTLCVVRGGERGVHFRKTQFVWTKICKAIAKPWKGNLSLVQGYGVLIWRAHSLPSVAGAGKLGIRFAIIAALPLWRRTPSLDQV